MSSIASPSVSSSSCLASPASYATRARLAAAAHERSPLADDVARGLVLPQPEEARVAQATVGGPLGEADLRHELRLDPGGAAHAGDLVVARERARGPLAASHLGTELAQHRAVEAGADLAGVDQLAVAVVAEQQ